MGRFLTSQGTLGITLRDNVITNYSAVANDRILANTSGGAFTITLPTSPLVNDMVQIIDVGGIAATNKITVARNGQKINGFNEDLTIDLSGSVTSLIYTGATWGWVFAAV
jgi:hypothetical protein